MHVSIQLTHVHKCAHTCTFAHAYACIEHMHTKCTCVHRYTCSYMYLEHRVQSWTHMYAHSTLCTPPYSSLARTSVDICAQCKSICTHACMYGARACTVHMRVQRYTCSYTYLEHRVHRRTHMHAAHCACIHTTHSHAQVCTYLHSVNAYAHACAHICVPSAHACACYTYREHCVQSQTHRYARSTLCMHP